MPEDTPVLARRLPELLMAIGVVHVVATPFLQPGLRPLLSVGLVDAVGGDRTRESAVWYATTGLLVVALGDAARTGRRRTGRLPTRFGGWVLTAGALITATMPASPGWLVMAVGATALRQEAQHRRRDSISAAGG